MSVSILRKAFVSLISILLAALALCLTASCSGGGGGGGGGGSNTPTTNFSVAGAVSKSEGMGVLPSALAGAEVTASCDLNGDGAISSAEKKTATTDSEGLYEVKMLLEEGAPTVVVSFKKDGVTPVFRTLDFKPNAALTVNIVMEEPLPLDCSGGDCALEDKSLEVLGLPEDVTGSAQIFNPVTDASSFPGGFGDSEGNLLISGVFATFDLEQDGETLDTLPAPVTLRMKIPNDTWNVITDIDTAPPDLQIEVPLYAFDEVKGTWVRQGTGRLETESGAIIPPSDLASIRSGEYVGEVYAVGEVSHFSTWNVDWPVESHAGLQACLVTVEGDPAAGAVVKAAGVTYTGLSDFQTTAEDGCFCVEVMRSEAPGEDLDQDGITGETQGVGLTAEYKGKYYDLGELDMDDLQSTCNSGPQQVGAIVLGPENQLDLSICTITGTVRDLSGEPVANASLFAYDEGISGDTWMEMCFAEGAECEFFSTSGADGSFVLRTPVQQSLNIFSSFSGGDAVDYLILFGETTAKGCPTQPVDLVMDSGFRQIQLTIATNGDQISWTPSLDMPLSASLYIFDSVGEPKWMVYGEELVTYLSGPITYGLTPAGTTQLYPEEGAAQGSIASGDNITLSFFGTDAKGNSVMVLGQTTVP